MHLLNNPLNFNVLFMIINYVKLKKKNLFNLLFKLKQALTYKVKLFKMKEMVFNIMILLF